MIAVFGGTFDPVHYGHLRPLLEVREALAVESVRLIPCNIPPHRGVPVAGAAQRLAMLKAAVDGVEGFEIDERELRRDGPSYMVDTLQSLRDEVGEAEPLVLILGMDAFLGLESWHRWQRLFELAHVVVMERPGSVMVDNGPLAELTARSGVESALELCSCPAGRLLKVVVTQLDISATGIRSRLQSGSDVRFLTPQAVLEYIEAHSLYAEPL